MATFLVLVREVHVQRILVEASNEKDAVWKVAEGEGEVVGEGAEYSHALDTDTWTAELIKRDSVLDWRPPAEEK